MNQRPLTISVLTPAYNAERYLRQLIESVQDQDYPHFEHIIIDDGSKDGTAAILAEYPHLKWISRQNRGQYATQNELLEQATGDVVVVICADDYFVGKDAFSRIARRFAQDPGLDVVVGRTIREVEGKRHYFVRPDVPVLLGWNLLRFCGAIQHCSVFVRRELIASSAIAFDWTYRGRGDWDWLLQIKTAAKSVGFVSGDLACWRQHPIQTSRTHREVMMKETQVLLKEHGVAPFAHKVTRLAFDFYGKAAHVLAILAQGARPSIHNVCDTNKLRVLACVDYYLPGYRGGGPAVSVSRMIERLSAEIEFRVFTRDRDLGEIEPYDAIRPGHWNDWDGVPVYYAAPAELGMRGLGKAIRETRPDVVYLNSYFSKMTRAALALRLLGKARGLSFVVAPRGEFSPGALGLKSGKKSAYLTVARSIGLHRDLFWHVSSDHEERDTRAAIDAEARCFVKPPDVFGSIPELGARPKHVGGASFAFISRISPKKNLLSAIRMLSQADGQVSFTIYGPIEDVDYWSRCEDAISSLPANVTCEYAGSVPPHQVQESLSQHHFFLFPTLGENFGHVIAEALAAGCPALLSDQTPWLDIAERACGWVMSLNDSDSWRAAIDECLAMDQASYEAMSAAARSYVADFADRTGSSDVGLRMFRAAAELHGSRAA